MCLYEDYIVWSTALSEHGPDDGMHVRADCPENAAKDRLKEIFNDGVDEEPYIFFVKQWGKERVFTVEVWAYPSVSYHSRFIDDDDSKVEL